MQQHLNLIVSCIPVSFHVRDLRYFFSKFVEETKFIQFHYRHRVDHRNRGFCWCPLRLDREAVALFNISALAGMLL